MLCRLHNLVCWTAGAMKKELDTTIDTLDAPKANGMCLIWGSNVMSQVYPYFLDLVESISCFVEGKDSAQSFIW